MKEETRGSFPSKLTVQQLITCIGRTFTDEKVVELQHPLQCTEIIKTNGKDFSVREVSPLEQRALEETSSTCEKMTGMILHRQSVLIAAL